MSDVLPFKGFRYALDKAGAPYENLVCPPYDVIDETVHKILANRSPHNAVHFILPPAEHLHELKTGTYIYTKQQKLWQNALDRGLIVEEKKPALYVYEQEFPHPLLPQNLCRRRGVFALKRLEEFGRGKVIPHEKTLAGPKADRLHLMRALNFNMSAIFGLYDDAGDKVQQFLRDQVCTEPPACEFPIERPEAVLHRLWVVTDPHAIRYLTTHLEQPVFIADGHHRYETALNYARELDGKNAYPADGGHHFIPVLFVAWNDPGLLILPTHRLVYGLEEFYPGNFLKNLQATFDIEAHPKGRIDRQRITHFLDEIDPDEEVRFVLFFADRYAVQGDKVFFLRLRQKSRSAGALSRLGVRLLQTEILQKYLGMDEPSIAQQEGLAYTRDPEEVFGALARQQVQMGFMTQAPSAAQVKAVCGAGQRMPQKSTFFYPKILTGLFFRRIDPREELQL